MFKNVSGQKIAVFAWDNAAGSAKTGDAANISAQISKDGGACAATNDVAPTELDAVDAPGIYIFDMTQAETNADLIVISPVSATGDIVLRPVIIYTQTVMRGTDGANTTVPDAAGTAPTAAEIKIAIEAAGSHLALIKAVTDVIPDAGALTTIDTNTARLTAIRAAVLTDWINAGRLDLILDAIKVKTDTLGGAGSITWVYTLTDADTGGPIDGASVWVTTDSAGANIIASGTTDDAGQVTFYLDAGVRYIWRSKAGYDFDNPDEETV